MQTLAQLLGESSALRGRAATLGSINRSSRRGLWTAVCGKPKIGLMVRLAANP